MAYQQPPRAGEISAQCPNPDMVAQSKDHFGNAAWDFACRHALELYVKDSGIQIKCSVLNGPCCVENSRDVFVNSSSADPLKSFFETTLKYLRIGPKG
jgi:hypothetical protein